MEEIRYIAQQEDEESTFSGEIITPNAFEINSMLDYTWNWHINYFDAGPILSVFNFPQINVNVADFPNVVKKCCIDGFYINTMPRISDQPNGTALISDEPEMAIAFKETAKLRKQFLPYFTEGVFIGDSILSQPTSAFVKGQVLDDRLLICILNDSSESNIITFTSNLSMWLPKGEEYTITYFDSTGKEIA